MGYLAHVDFTCTFELLFASSNRVLVQNVYHENDLIFMRMTEQVTYISFAPCTDSLSFLDSYLRFFVAFVLMQQHLFPPLLTLPFSMSQNCALDH